MNNNNLSTITNQQTITSMEIAEITGKKHKDVLKAIRKMEPAWEKTCGRKFAPTHIDFKMPSGGIRKDAAYALTKTECLFVATKFNDEARAKLVLRWEELEKERVRLQATKPNPSGDETLPSDPRNLTRKQLLLMALEAEEERERLKAEKVELAIENEFLEIEKTELEAQNYGLMLENGQKDQQIKTLQERTAYLNVIMSDTTNVTVSQIAQDYGMAAVAFNKLLNGLRIQRRVGEQWILYSEYLNLGYVGTRMIPIHHSDGPDTFKPMTTWTQKGRHFIYDQLKKHGVLPLIERKEAGV